jgi:hypothetical protein
VRPVGQLVPPLPAVTTSSVRAHRGHAARKKAAASAGLAPPARQPRCSPWAPAWPRWWCWARYCWPGGAAPPAGARSTSPAWAGEAVQIES